MKGSVMVASGAPQTVSVGGRRMRLTNPDKVVYPATGTTKAEVIAYYVEIAPYLLPHVAGRPVTRKRWVDGVGTDAAPGEVFFEKNLPASAPSWIRRIHLEHKSRTTTYPVFESVADLAWAGQVAALELHVPQWTVDRLGDPRNPDRLVLDLDPGPGTGLAECVTVALRCRELLADLGLDAHPVTSGSKGLHLYAPLDRTHDADYVNRFAHELARAMEGELPDLVVSSMRKSDRHGKVLLDWSQNNGAKTTIAPYSLRGRAEPFVAAPREWDELDADLRHLTMDEVLERMRDRPDPLAPLAPTDVEADGTDRLTLYRSKRDASRTPEPVPEAAPVPRESGDPVFVIQEHHASRLHWDLRLEHDGVLVSWALPKGVPTDPEVNHLAVQTEDHPMEYLTFEGTIPAGEYGGGEMTIWDTGTYTLEKWRDAEVIATLTGRDGGGLGAPRRIALIRTGENWLCHLMKDQGGSRRARSTPASQPTRSASMKAGFVAPMLATAGDAVDLDDQDDWVFEMKWDGIRAVAVVDGRRVGLFTRNGNDVTAAYPEVVEALADLGLTDTVLDGELVALDDAGVPDFGRLQQRMGLTRPAEVAALLDDVPVTYLLFDLLRHDGHGLANEQHTTRRSALEQLGVDDGGTILVPQTFDGSLEQAVASSRRLGLEGVVAKRRESRYRSGRRSSSWIKIKHERVQEVVVGGWRPGRGERSGGIGSLLVGLPTPDGLRYVGRVGTGFSAAELTRLASTLRSADRATSPFDDVPADVARDARWVTPRLVGEVSFGEWTAGGHLRHPVWRGLRPDKTPTEVVVE